MQYKLISNITNSSGGTVELTESQLSELTNGSVDTGGVTLSGGDEIILLCELYNRYNLDSCRYYRSGSDNVQVEVADSDGVWYTLSTSVSSDYVEVDLTTYNPRWVRITHNVSTSYNVYEVEIYSAGSNILFGSSGEADSYGMDRTGNTIQAVQVFNNTDSVRNIHVFIEDDSSTVGDDLLSIGLTSSGTFYSKHEFGLNFPNDFDWNNGVHSGTIVTSSGHLTLSGVSTSGIYYSPVFDTTGYEDCRFFWEQDNNSGSKVDFISSIDSEECFGVRQYNIPPSGGWSSGTMPSELDPEWSISIGSILFEPLPNNTILELRNNKYVQFVVTLSGVVSPHIYKAGVECPVTISGVYPGSYKDVYLQLSGESIVDQQLGLLCWYKE